ncbi:hypothetical protein QBC39DRAFT_361968 [Podospora conica]|nr:hypothetical protein QBC39DRAFT_361968 [Schizothecium conicum]
MCPTNSELRVCNVLIDELRAPGSRLNFAPNCRRLLWQYVIRNRLTKAPGDAVSEDWDGPDGLLQSLYLVRPDGTPWSVVWSGVVHPRLVTAIVTRARSAAKYGLARWKAGRYIWHDWVDGFLSPAWDGSSFDETTARRLLAQAGCDAGGPGSVKAQAQAQAEKQSQPAAPTTIPGGLDVRVDDDNNAEPVTMVSAWLAGLSFPADLETVVLRDAGTVVPDDSVTLIGRPKPFGSRPPATRRPGSQATRRPPGLPTVVEEAAAVEGEDATVVEGEDAAIVETPAAEEDDDDDDSDVDAWLDTKSIPELAAMLSEGVVPLIDFNFLLVQHRVGSLLAPLLFSNEDLATILDDRETLLEQMLRVDLAIERKLARIPSGTPDEGDFSWVSTGFGHVWRTVCSGHWLTESPVLQSLEEEALRRLDEGDSREQPVRVGQK